MKKFVYLCGMMLLSLNTMAQIDPYDRNWKVVVLDDFDQPNRQFDNTFQEPNRKWTAFSHWLYPSGITKEAENNHQIYQWRNCLIDSPTSTLKLYSKYIRSSPITCETLPDDCDFPPNLFGTYYHCDSSLFSLFYYSGMIESYPVIDTIVIPNSRDEEYVLHRKGRFRYGYYEMRCKMPVHAGAFVAFWLWNAEDSTFNDKHYESIDIFERSWQFTDSTVHHNIHDTLGNPRRYLNKVHVGDNYRFKVFPVIPYEEEDLSGWHTFSCLWMPDKITFYRDGQITAEESEQIPSHHLALKINFAVDRYALQDHNALGIPEWFGSDTLFVDYILVRQLQLDCNKEEVITCQNEMDMFDFAIKKSISITSAIDNVKIADTCKVTFRSTDTFQVTGPFQIDDGGEFTVIIQDCPTELLDNRKTNNKTP